MTDDEEERLKSLLDYEEGDKVFISGTNRFGRVRFIGPVHFAFGKGLFAGLELSAPEGRNNGTVDGHRYFTCKPKYGLFVMASTLRKELPLEDRSHRFGEMGVNEDSRHTHLASGTPIANKTSSWSKSNLSSPAVKSATKSAVKSSNKSTPSKGYMNSIFERVAAGSGVGEELISAEQMIKSEAFKKAVSSLMSDELLSIKKRLEKCEEENESLRQALKKETEKNQSLAESEEAFRVIAEMCKEVREERSAA